MTNGVRIQNNKYKLIGGYKRDGERRMDSVLIQPQQSTSDESYDDGFIDYTHEL